MDERCTIGYLAEEIDAVADGNLLQQQAQAPQCHALVTHPARLRRST